MIVAPGAIAGGPRVWKTGKRTVAGEINEGNVDSPRLFQDLIDCRAPNAANSADVCYPGHKYCFPHGAARASSGFVHR
jgi:hypothetical protein